MSHRPEIQHKLMQIYETKLEEMWTIEDVKAMSNEHTQVHKRALALNLPHGLITSFRAQLREFKQIYRDKYSADRGLNGLSRGHNQNDR